MNPIIAYHSCHVLCTASCVCVCMYIAWWRRDGVRVEPYYMNIIVTGE